MTTERSHEYAARQLQLADEALSDAQYLFEGNRLKAAVNRAYYGMFHAVQAALANIETRRPKTHAGAIHLFGKEFVATGKLDRLFLKDLQDAFDLRQESDYDIYAHLGVEEVRAAVAKAEAFVAEVKKVLDVR